MENYAVTRYRQNGDAETQVVDSHLISQNGQHGAGYTDYDIVSYLTSPADGDYFITAKTVSYTHLDVYKRQAVRHGLPLESAVLVRLYR